MGDICSKSQKEPVSDNGRNTSSPVINSQPSQRGLNDFDHVPQTAGSASGTTVQHNPTYGCPTNKRSDNDSQRMETHNKRGDGASKLSQNQKTGADSGCMTQSKISSNSTTSLEQVDILVQEQHAAQRKSENMKQNEMRVEADMKRANIDGRTTDAEINRLQKELSDAQEQRKIAENQVQVINKELESAREKLEKEKQQYQEQHQIALRAKEEEINKAKEDTDNERKRYEQDIEKLTNDLERLKREYDDAKSKYEKNISKKKLTATQEQIEDYQKNINIIKIKDHEIKQLQKEKDELYLRLSAMAGRKLTDNNPNIADLSDENRPTKLGETFSQLYDNEWTDAFSYLETLDDGTTKYDERKCIDILYQTVSIAYEKALNKANAELDKLTRAVDSIGGGDNPGNKDFLKQMKDARKKRVLPDEDLKQEYLATLNERFPDIAGATTESVDWDKFCNACINVCWLMAVQDPPVYLDRTVKTGDILDKSKYKEYTQSGLLVEYPVWPVMLLHEGGSVLSKGVVQGRKQQMSSSVHVTSTSGQQQNEKKKMSQSLYAKKEPLSVSKKDNTAIIAQSLTTCFKTQL